MGGAQRSSQSSQPQSLGTLSLGPILAAQAFGFGTGVSPGGGGLTITGGNQFLPQLFNPQQFQSLGDLARPLPSFLGDTAGVVGEQASDVLQNILPGINELATTGFADDISGLANFLFQNEIAPGLEEQLGAGFGLGVGDTDLAAILAREGTRTSLEAANAATQNRILGLQLAQQAPGAVAEQVGAVESLLQQGVRQGSEAGQLLDLFRTFGGIDTQAGGVGGGSRGRSSGFNIVS